jgi:hypothetical protein
MRVVGRILRKGKNEERIGVPDRTKEGRPGSGH